MRTLSSMRLALLLCAVGSAQALAAECDAPARRDPLALQEASQQDEMLAGALDKVIYECSSAGTGERCARAKADCTELARSAAERQGRHEEGAFLLDLTKPVGGANYSFANPGPAPAHSLVSCEGSPPELTSAAEARRAASVRHARIAAEYASFVTWAAGAADRCREGLKLAASDSQAARVAEAQRQEQQALAAQAAADQAAQKAQADEAARVLAAKQEAAKKAEEERKALAAEQAKRAEEQKQRQLAEAAQQRAKEAAQKQERARQEAEEKAKAEERKRQEAAAAEARRKEEAESARRQEQERQEREERHRKERLEQERADAKERTQKERELAKEAAEREERARAEARAQAEKAAHEKERADRQAREAQARKQQEVLLAQEEARRVAAQKESLTREQAQEAKKEQVRKELEAAKAQEAARLESLRKQAEEDERKRQEDKLARRKAEDEQELQEKKRKQEELAKLAEASQAKVAQLEHSASAVVDQHQERSEEEAAQAARVEEARRAEAAKRLEAAGWVDPNSRSGGALGVHGAAALATLDAATPAQSTLIGAAVNLRKGFWFAPPLEGMQKGLELRATGFYLTSLAGDPVRLLQASPEMRVWLGRLALGASGDYRRLEAGGGVQEVLAAGPSLGVALVDDQEGRLILGARWLPLLGGGSQVGAADLEAAYGHFTFLAEAGLRSPSSWYLAASLGLRLRF